MVLNHRGRVGVVATVASLAPVVSSSAVSRRLAGLAVTALLLASCGPTASSSPSPANTGAPASASPSLATASVPAPSPGGAWTNYEAPTGTTLGGIWVGPDGTVYTSPTSSSLPNALLALGPDGTPKPGWPVPLPDYYLGNVAFGSDGSIYVATATQDATAGHLVAIDPDGKIVQGWPYPTQGTVGSVFSGPDGSVYAVVSSKARGDSVLALSSDGRLKPGWPYPLEKTVKVGSVTFQIDDRVTVRPDGSVYFIGTHGLVGLDPAGHVKPGWPLAGSTWQDTTAFAADGTIYEARFNSHTVMSTIAALDENASPKPGWVPPTVYGTPFLRIGPDGTLYAVEGCCGNPTQQVLAFGPDGTPRAGWSTYAQPVKASIVVGLDVGATGDVYLTIAPPPGQTGSNRVVGLGPDGRVLKNWPATFEGQFSDLLLAPDGTTYVVSGNTIAAFAPDGSVRPGWPYVTSGEIGYSSVALARGGGVYVVSSTSLLLLAPGVGSAPAPASEEPSPPRTVAPGMCLVVPEQYCGTAAIVALNFQSKPAAGQPRLAYVGLTLPTGTPIFAPDSGTLRTGGIQPAFDAAGHEHDLPMRLVTVGSTTSPSAMWTFVVSPVYTKSPDVPVEKGATVATASADPTVGEFNLLLAYADAGHGMASVLTPDVARLVTLFGITALGTVSEVAVPHLAIDLPVTEGTQGPTLCGVAYHLPQSAQPGAHGAVYLYANPRKGMFLPLLTASQTADGKALIGLRIVVTTNTGWQVTYLISEVHRHWSPSQPPPVYDPSVAPQVWLQTGEGPTGSPNLLIRGDLYDVAPADTRVSQLSPHPVACP